MTTEKVYIERLRENDSLNREASSLPMCTHVRHEQLNIEIESIERYMGSIFMDENDYSLNLYLIR